MTNYGNTGQRYKMPKVTKAEKTTDGNILVTLSCGHTYTIKMQPGSDVKSWLEWAQERVDKEKRQRCNECEAKR